MNLSPIIHSHLFSIEVSTSQVEWQGRSYHFRLAMTGTKGDWPFLRSAFALSCGFNCKDKCHRCHLRESRCQYYDRLFPPVNGCRLYCKFSLNVNHVKDRDQTLKLSLTWPSVVSNTIGDSPRPRSGGMWKVRWRPCRRAPHTLPLSRSVSGAPSGIFRWERTPSTLKSMQLIHLPLEKISWLALLSWWFEQGTLGMHQWPIAWKPLMATSLHFAVLERRTPASLNLLILPSSSPNIRCLALRVAV